MIIERKICLLESLSPEYTLQAFTISAMSGPVLCKDVVHD